MSAVDPITAALLVSCSTGASFVPTCDISDQILNMALPNGGDAWPTLEESHGPPGLRAPGGPPSPLRWRAALVRTGAAPHAPAGPHPAGPPRLGPARTRPAPTTAVGLRSRPCPSTTAPPPPCRAPRRSRSSSGRRAPKTYAPSARSSPRWPSSGCCSRRRRWPTTSRSPTSSWPSQRAGSSAVGRCTSSGRTSARCVPSPSTPRSSAGESAPASWTGSWTGLATWACRGCSA